MTLLEAISPTARALLKQLDAAGHRGGVRVIGIVKNNGSRHARVHVPCADNPLQPVCGGGHQAKAVAAHQGWQETIEAPNCERCMAILQRRRTLQSAKAAAEVEELINQI